MHSGAVRLLFVTAAASASARSDMPTTIRFASSYTDGMVLQQAPYSAVVWGFCDHGANVTVHIARSTTLATATTTATMAAEEGRAFAAVVTGNTFKVSLHPTESSMTTTYTITATATATTSTAFSALATASLSDVLFGDVWVCSGQSNMQYPVGKPGCWNPAFAGCNSTEAKQSPQCSCSPRGEYPDVQSFPHGCGCINNTAAEVQDMANYPAVKLLQIFPAEQSDPELEANNSGWRSAADMVAQESANFSAVCWLFGRDLQRALSPPRPIGLVEATLGGTPIQSWSSPEALSACKHLNTSWEWPASTTGSELFNGMVAPLLQTTIKGAVWYQGEANANDDGRQYRCAMKAMVADWRRKWAGGSGADPTFPFGWVQLNSNGAAENWTAAKTSKNQPSADDPYGAWRPGFSSIRYAQTAATHELSNTFQAVVLDTPVGNGWVHSPFKQPVGARLARAALATAYKTQDVYSNITAIATLAGGPSAKSVLITVRAGGSNDGSSVGGEGEGEGMGAEVEVDVRSKYGFEVLGNDSQWHPTPLVQQVGCVGQVAASGCSSSSSSSGSAASNTLMLTNVPEGAVAVRYLWYTTPCSMDQYKCPVYVKVPALGAESGEMEYLPLGPFIQPL